MIYVQATLPDRDPFTDEQLDRFVQYTEAAFLEATRLLGNFAGEAQPRTKHVRTLTQDAVRALWNKWSSDVDDTELLVHPRHLIFTMFRDAEPAIRAENWAGLVAIYQKIIGELGCVYVPSTQGAPHTAFTRYTLRGYVYLRDQLKTLWWDVDPVQTAPRYHEVVTRTARMMATYNA